jgi:hypothetical protein
MPRLKKYEKPVRQQSVEYRLQVYDGEGPEDILKSLKGAYGLDGFPPGSKFELDAEPNSYTYEDCSWHGECYLVWTAEENDFDLEVRVREYNKLVEAQAKRQAKKKL